MGRSRSLNILRMLACGAMCHFYTFDQAAAQSQPTPTLQQTLNYISGAVKAAVIFNKTGQRFTATTVLPTECDSIKITIVPFTGEDEYTFQAHFRIIDVIPDLSGDDFTILQCAQADCFEGLSDQLFTLRSPSKPLGTSFRNALNHLQRICGKTKSSF